MNKPMTMLRPQDHDEILRSALSVLADDFKHGELAFLALTSKPEGHFRDRLAYRLYMHFQQEPILVCREWRRIDLAVISLESDMPLLLLELKWMYSLNGCENKTEYFDRVIRDEKKALRAAAPTTSVYTLLLATHPKAPIPRRHFPIVKYAGEVNRSFSQSDQQKQLLYRLALPLPCGSVSTKYAAMEKSREVKYTRCQCQSYGGWLGQSLANHELRLQHRTTDKYI